MISDTSLEALKDISHLHVCRYAQDATSAIQNDAVLQGISGVESEKNGGDGFRYLIGLRRGTSISPFLKNFFA
jgi:hypothetical protein